MKRLPSERPSGVDATGAAEITHLSPSGATSSAGGTNAMNARRHHAGRFRSLPAAARAYVALVVLAGVAALALAAWRVRFDHPGLFSLLLVLAVATSTAKIELPLGRSQSNLSLSHAINFWALLALGPGEAVCIASVGAWSQCTLGTGGRNPLHRTVFSVASLILTVSLAGLPLEAMLDSGVPTLASLIRAAAVIAPIYFFLNSALIACAIALSTRQPFGRIWHHNFLWSAPSYLAGAGLAAVAAAASARGWSGWLALLAVPLYLVFRSYHTVVARLREEQDQTRHAMDVQLATIEALALAIEAKAGCTPEHIRSIQQYAAMLAKESHLSDADVQAVRTAALLHDVGNMAVPEHILSKPEALTSEEFERVKIHPRVGAEILRQVPFGAPVAELVLHHHERWDGLGYPAGLRGDDIPLGARILAIADCYSTLQAKRPYRPARTRLEALAVMREYAGKAFDPALVDLFVTALQASEASQASVAAVTPPSEDEWCEQEVALEDIARAHREEQMLYEIAQSLGSSLGVADAMALVHEKVSKLVPFVTCALFLGDDTDGYVCRYAHGPGTEALLAWAPRSGRELSQRLPSCADGRGAHGEELASMLSCPLLFEGRLIGALVIYHSVPDCFTDEHRRVLGRVSEQTAAVIFNSTRFEQTQHESHTDILTGLPNRRSLGLQVEARLRAAERAKSAVSVVVLDLDRLKEINDTYGHEAGDLALMTVASALRTAVRQSDLSARFAGDEFVVVLTDCDQDQEARRVRDLQTAVAVHPFEPRPGVRISLSISAGPARFPDDGRTFDELLGVADERMYRDKAGRRARISHRPAAEAECVGRA